MKQMLATLVAATLCVTPAILDAQADDTHRGYWLSFGGGGGWSGSGRGGMSYMRMGGTPHGRAQVGAEVVAWWREGRPGQDEQRASVTLTALIYPFYPASGEQRLSREWYVSGGFGVAEAEFGNGQDAEGISTTVGTGFHFRLGQKFFVTTGGEFLLQFFADETVTAFLFSVGFSWH